MCVCVWSISSVCLWFCLSFENFFSFNFFCELWTGGYKSGLQVNECHQFFKLRAPAKKEKEEEERGKKKKKKKKTAIFLLHCSLL